MPTVSYEYEFNYARDLRGDPFPILPLSLQGPERQLETSAYLDSGAEYSVFQADLAPILGLDLLGGQRRTYALANRQRLEAAVRDVTLSHPDLGVFPLAIGFAFGLSRNLLGRDFFDRVQIGFRERYSTFFITPTP